MTAMTHDGYLADLEIDEGAGVIHGRVVNARAVLTFEGETLADLKAAFSDTIADYREWCKERGVEPEKPYSGTLSLRIAPELHRRVAEQAAKAGESINQFITECLEEVA
jgi:predicted HicB family RNase H-like nuclease